MARKIVYLINPISGTKGKLTLPELIATTTRRHNIPFEIISTRANGDYTFLQKKIADDAITDVVICGGDGSVNAVSAALLGISVNIGIIPLGSGNGLALAAKISRNTKNALAIILQGKVSYIDGFYINKKFSCMLAGIGFDALVAHEFAKQKKRGLKTYVRVSIRNFFKTKPYLFEIKSDKKTFSTKAYLISIANSNQFGNNFTIAPKASLNDGLLDIVVVKKMSKWLLAFAVFRQVLGLNAMIDLEEKLLNKNILYFQTSAITISNTSLAPLHIDGDPAKSAAHFDIKVIPNAIRLLQP